MFELIPFYVVTVIIWGVVMFRHSVFNGIGLFVGKGNRYKKSQRVDLGVAIMFASILLGVTMFASIETLSANLIAALIVIGLCGGGVVVATGIGDEWRQNRA